MLLILILLLVLYILYLSCKKESGCDGDIYLPSSLFSENNNMTVK